MKDYIEKRVVSLAEYILKNKCAVRNVAKEFKISKSTVHTAHSICVGRSGTFRCIDKQT